MRVSVSTVCMTELSWRECLAEARRAGYDAVELLMIPGWVHMMPGQVAPDTLLAACRREGMTLCGLHAGALDGLNEQTLHDTAAYIESVLEYGRQLGVDLVNVNGGFVPDGLPAEERRAGLARLARGLRDLQPALERLDMRLTLENHHHFQLEMPSDYEAVLGGLPAGGRIGVTVDTGHFTSVEVDMPVFIRQYAPWILHVHVKDHIGMESVPLGRGETCNETVVHTLHTIGYEGFLSVELEVRDRENALLYVREARTYMDRLLKEAS